MFELHRKGNQQAEELAQRIPEIKRRTSPRRLARVCCEAVAAEGFTHVGGTLRDFSEEGMLLQASTPLVLGEELYLSFRAPRTTQWVSLVAHVSRAYRTRDQACLAGITISDMDSVERSILMGAISLLPMRPRSRRAALDYAAFVAEVSGFAASRIALH